MAIESGEAFTDRTLVVSGGSRGIGLAIALGAAKLGANVVLLAKTAEPHPKLPGTVYTAVAEVEAAGGKGLRRRRRCPQGRGRAARRRRRGRAIRRRRHRREQRQRHLDRAAPRSCRAKKFDLMMDINVRGTFLLTKAALPHLREVRRTRRC